jgi:regulatory protein
MPRITKLGFQRNQKRVNVHLDGQFSFGLNTAVALKNGLKKGQELSHETIKRLLISSWQEELYEQVLQFLGIRPRSRKEVGDYLKRRFAKLKGRQKLTIFRFKEEFEDVKRTLIDKTIARLEINQLLDDEGFARWFVGQRLRLKPKGKQVLRLELRQKGIEPGIIQAILADDAIYSGKQEQAAAYQVAEKALRQLQGLVEDKSQQRFTLKRRLYQRLASRGFPFELVKSVVDDLLSLK